MRVVHSSYRVPPRPGLFHQPWAIHSTMVWPMLESSLIFDTCKLYYKQVELCIPGPLPLACTASLHPSSRSPKVCHSVPCTPEVPTPPGAYSAPQPHQREPACPGRPPHISVVGRTNKSINSERGYLGAANRNRCIRLNRTD